MKRKTNGLLGRDMDSRQFSYYYVVGSKGFLNVDSQAEAFGAS